MFITILTTLLTWLAYLVASILVIAILYYTKQILTAVEFPTPANTIYMPPRETLLQKWFGMLPTILKEQAAEPQLRWARAAEAEGKTNVVYERSPGGRVIMVLDPHDLYFLMCGPGAKALQKPENPYSNIERFGFGRYSLVAVRDVDIHRQQRRIATPAFSKKNLRSISDNIVPKHTSALVETIKKQIGIAGAPTALISVGPLYDNMTLDIIAESAFRTVNIGEFNVSAAFNKIVSMIGLSVADLLPRWIALRLPIQRNIEMPRILAEMNHACDTMAARCKSDLAARGITTLEDYEDDTKNDSTATTTLMDIFVLNPSMDTEMLRSQSKTLLLAGGETTSKLLVFSTLLLSTHPQVQNELFEEVRDVVPLGGASPAFEDLAGLKLLRAVLNESLRLLPPVPILARGLSEDVTLPSSGTTIKKGMGVLLCPFAVHRCKKTWGNDADDFKPARWFEEKIAKREDASAAEGITFMPFLFGARSCIGNVFAMNEAMAALAVLVRNFEFTFPEGVALPKRTLKLTMRPNPDLKVEVTVRSA